LLLLGPAIFVAAAFAPSTAPAPDYKKDIFPVFKKYCGGCHGVKDAPGGVALMTYTDLGAIKANRLVWERVIKNLSNQHMPPAGSPAPTEAERDKLVNFVRATLGPPVANPGRVTMRRLNREEYNNTVRDLLGVDVRPGDDFPSDDVGYGFDNIGDVLSMSPLLMEKYLKAAQEVSEAAIYTPHEQQWRVAGVDTNAPASTPIENGGLILYSNATMEHEFRLPAGGSYKLRVSAFQDKGGPDNAKMALSVNGQVLKVVDVSATHRRPETYEVDFHAGYGKATVGAAFTNDYYVPKTATSPQVDRNLGIFFIEVDGPIGAPTTIPPTQNKIIFVKATESTRVDCERKVLAAFASKAYRRPVTKGELDKLVSIAELAHKNGDSYERGIQLGITATLCSPNFLFRVESPVGETLGSYEIASRLSYFLWSSMPDDELFALAAKNELQQPAVLAAQVKRMLSDPRASALADNFAGQWLQTRKLAIVAPDRALFPSCNDQIRRDMATETKMFFMNILRGDRSVLEFINGKYSFLNGPLAALYGIDGVQGNDFRRVELPADRAGILTQASVLTVTSNPTRTSPVKRGKWILENILGTPPAPPPPGVGVLKEENTASLDSASLRERMEQHRKDPACATCHAQMDGLGFALENYNAVGVRREKDGRFGIDASGTLPDGSKFTGPAELRTVLMKRKDQFVRCLSEKMLTFALGRGLEPYDDLAVERIVKAVSGGQYKFSALVTAIVESDPFRKSRVQK
jgi:hypothetical protein